MHDRPDGNVDIVAQVGDRAQRIEMGVAAMSALRLASLSSSGHGPVQPANVSVVISVRMSRSRLHRSEGQNLTGRQIRA